MTPEEIKTKFGAQALDTLYDMLLDRPVHALADWVLLYQSEERINQWLKQLTEDKGE